MNVNIALKSTLRPLVVGLPMMILPTLAGFPGVACVTPIFWLLALLVGGYCAERSENHLADAALGGVVLGLVLGAVSSVIFVFAFEVAPSERPQTALFSAIMAVGGMIACTLFATAFAAIASNRSQSQDR